VPTAKASAKKYLTYLPFQTPEDLITKINEFTKSFPMLSKYQLYIAHEVEDIKTKEILAKMREMIEK